MTKPKHSSDFEGKQVGVRLPGDLIRQIEEYGQKLRESTPGTRISFADAVRVLLRKALDDEENGK